ncbi:hypothetical protein Taro_025616 [Colocasia esculenta]|uniref:Uncharacterized protein n=1 Tax=Colocasia esculenta TaxID=4460 RepID=A0A843V9B7_COLES|nr:hypothetical protein [Colocasia esculenta]
MERPWCARQS